MIFFLLAILLVAIVTVSLISAAYAPPREPAPDPAAEPQEYRNWVENRKSSDSYAKTGRIFLILMNTYLLGSSYLRHHPVHRLSDFFRWQLLLPLVSILFLIIANISSMNFKKSQKPEAKKYKINLGKKWTLVLLYLGFGLFIFWSVIDLF